MSPRALFVVLLSFILTTLAPAAGASDRTALFNKFIRQCSGVLEAEPTSPARGEAYWNMIAREAAPWATL